MAWCMRCLLCKYEDLSLDTSIKDKRGLIPLQVQPWGTDIG